jgi:hypothetical protein
MFNAHDVPNNFKRARYEPITPDTRMLTEVSPVSGKISNEIEYRDVIYISLDIQGGHGYSKSISAVLNFQLNMCYLKHDFMGLSVSAEDSTSQCTAMYGCGELYKMDITLIDGTPINYDCMLMNHSLTKHAGILGINHLLIEGEGVQSITLIPDSLSEINFTGTNAEYTVSKGKLHISDKMTFNEHCEGWIESFHYEENFNPYSYNPQVSVIIRNGNHYRFERITISFNTSLAQTRYSSAFKNFDYIEIGIQGIFPRLYRKNLGTFSDSRPHLEIGVDIMRNLVVHFINKVKLFVSLSS